VGAIGHYLEAAGIPTVGISLVRENTAFIRPPRALWVPFDLGRPLGAPNEPAFQLDVLRATLTLLDRTDGPVILEDYTHDAPGQGEPENMEGLVCPVPLRKAPASSSPSALVQAVLDETTQLAPWHEVFCTTHKRTTVGVSKMNLKDAILFIGDILHSGNPDRIPQSDWPTTLRFACEDLRNFYLEAASMRPGGSATTASLVDWFWGDTSAGKLLLALHPICLHHDHEPMRAVAVVPRAQEHRLSTDPQAIS